MLANERYLISFHIKDKRKHTNMMTFFCENIWKAIFNTSLHFFRYCSFMEHDSYGRTWNNRYVSVVCVSGDDCRTSGYVVEKGLFYRYMWKFIVGILSNVNIFIWWAVICSYDFFPNIILANQYFLFFLGWWCKSVAPPYGLHSYTISRG